MLADLGRTVPLGSFFGLLRQVLGCQAARQPFPNDYPLGRMAPIRPLNNSGIWAWAKPIFLPEKRDSRNVAFVAVSEVPSGAC